MLQSHSMSAYGTRTVLVVDDHPVVRKGVRTIIESMDNFEVVGEAADGREAVEQADAIHPDIVVLDLSMPQFDGLFAIADLKRHHAGVEILVFTLHASDNRCFEAMDAGARGYVCKTESDHLVPALEAVSRRQAYFSPTVNEARIQETHDEAWDRRPLTDRERQIVRLVAHGHSNKAIARMLSISVKTTETHRASAMRKTGTNSAAALTIYAARNGIIDL